jgi:hypothetical protein
MLKTLEDNKFEREALPSSIGGSWTYAKFDVWINQRIRIDVKSSPTMAKLSDVKSDTLSRLAAAADIVRTEDRRERKRRMDAIYARKRRERERAEEQVLQAKCLKMSEANLKLQNENKAFEQMLADAKKKVMVYEQSKSAPPVAPTALVSSNSNDVNQVIAMLKQKQQQQSQQAQTSQAPIDIASLQYAIAGQPSQVQYQAAAVQALERERAFREQLLSLLNGGAVSPHLCSQLLNARETSLQDGPSSYAARNPVHQQVSLNSVSNQAPSSLLAALTEAPAFPPTYPSTNTTSTQPTKSIGQYFLGLLRKR